MPTEKQHDPTPRPGTPTTRRLTARQRHSAPKPQRPTRNFPTARPPHAAALRVEYLAARRPAVRRSWRRVFMAPHLHGAASARCGALPVRRLRCGAQGGVSRCATLIARRLHSAASSWRRVFVARRPHGAALSPCGASAVALMARCPHGAAPLSRGVPARWTRDDVASDSVASTATTGPCLNSAHHGPAPRPGTALGNGRHAAPVRGIRQTPRNTVQLPHGPHVRSCGWKCREARDEGHSVE